MNNTESKRFYTLQFSETVSVSVRRFAWFLNKPMTQTVEKIILLLSLSWTAQKSVSLAKTAGNTIAALLMSKNFQKMNSTKF